MIDYNFTFPERLMLVTTHAFTFSLLLRREAWPIDIDFLSVPRWEDALLSFDFFHFTIF